MADHDEGSGVTPEQRAELRAIARREAAKAPPLTPGQLARVAALLRPAGGRNHGGDTTEQQP